MPGRYAQQKHREHFYKYTPPHKGDYEKICHYRRRHCHHTYTPLTESKPEKSQEPEKSKSEQNP